MLSENQRIKGLISSVIDIVLLIAAYLLANFLRFNWLPFFEEGGAGPALDIARSPMVALGWAGYAVVMVLLYWSRGLYNPSRLRGLWQRSTTIAFGNALGVVGFMALLFVFRLQNFSRGVMLLLYGFSTGFLIFKRMIKRWYDRARNRKGEDLRHILLVGGGDMAAKYLLALEHNPYYGFHVDGYLAPYANPDLDVRYLGGYDKMEVTLDEPGIDEVVVALDAAEMHMLTRAFAACDKHGTRITMVPFYNDYLPAAPVGTEQLTRPSVSTEAPAASTEADSFALSETGKAFLEKMCYFLPDWSDDASLNDEFWRNFLFSSFTCPDMVDGETAMTICGEQELVTTSWGQAVKVSREDSVVPYVRLALGLEMPSYAPAIQDVSAGQTLFYFEDGYYYIGLSDFGDVGYSFRGCYPDSVNGATVIFDVYSGTPDDTIGTICFTIVPADNENGFTIAAKSSDFGG